MLTGLGNGYDVSRSGERPLLVGGGVGIPPLYGLARRLAAQGKARDRGAGLQPGLLRSSWQRSSGLWARRWSSPPPTAAPVCRAW